MAFTPNYSCSAPLLILMILKMHILIIFAKPQVPCYFIFGDSLVDNGNNNDLVTQAKVNYHPYGVDFPGGKATGRFSNGENTADILGKLLGFDKYIPPFATAKGREILKGVNYGSGGAGIRNETGRNLGGRISLDQQLFNHGTTVLQIFGILRNSTLLKEHLSKCMYTVGMGSNDYINNYYMPEKYNTSSIYTPEKYADVLIQQYTKQLETLYNYGARKVAVFGVGLAGCTPAEISNFGADASGCVDKINAAIALFNDKLKPLVDGLNHRLTGATFIYINSTNISLGDPSLAGFTVVNAPCCKASVNFGKGQCKPDQPPCSNRDTYVFWDEFHPTERSINFSVTRSYTAASPSDVYPMDISTLAKQ